MGQEEQRELAWYVLFENHTQGLLLDSLLRENGLHATIVPTPRALNKSCGVALALKAEELEAVRALIDREGAQILRIASMERDINPFRDRYC